MLMSLEVEIHSREVGLMASCASAALGWATDKFVADL
jgi:hypothetical protein